jgi:hypothetical protein
MVQGKAACTYCSTVCNNSSKSIPAIERWGDDRVRDAARVAKERDLKFYLLSAPVGLIPDSQSVPMCEPILRDDEVAGKVELVAPAISDSSSGERPVLQRSIWACSDGMRRSRNRDSH